MIILGIDPGTSRIGYGFIKKEAGGLTLLQAGILSPNSQKFSLSETKAKIDSLIKRFRPEVLAIETLYFSKNRKTAMAVAEARGTIILSALEHGLRVKEYGPNQIKLGITGYGLADKKAVLKMVRLTLKNVDPKILDDASDALAVAIMAGGDMEQHIPKIT